MPGALSQNDAPQLVAEGGDSGVDVAIRGDHVLLHRGHVVLDGREHALRGVAYLHLGQRRLRPHPVELPTVPGPPRGGPQLRVRTTLRAWLVWASPNTS